MRISAAQCPFRVAIGSQTGDASAVTVAVSQSSKSTARWLIRAEARFRDQGTVREVGRVVTIPPSEGGSASKVVLIGGAPGAAEWVLQIERYDKGDDDAVDRVVDVDASAGPSVGQSGVVAVEGESSIVACGYEYACGAIASGTSTATIPDGQRIRTLSVWQSGSGGKVVVGDRDGISLPPDGAVTLSPNLVGPVSLAFVGFPTDGGGWFAE